MSASDVKPGPPPWWRPVLVIGSGLLALAGFVISPGLGLVLAVPAVVVWVGTSVWAARDGHRRSRSLRDAGEKPDLRYLQRRLLVYFWLVLVCLVGATVGVVRLLASPDHRGPAWPLILVLVLMGAGAATIWVFARVVLPRQREQRR